MLVSPPGETLQETLGVLGMSQSGLAERTGRSEKMGQWDALLKYNCRRKGWGIVRAKKLEIESNQ